MTLAKWLLTGFSICIVLAILGIIFIILFPSVKYQPDKYSAMNHVSSPDNQKSMRLEKKSTTYCPYPTNLVGPFQVSFKSPSFQEIAAENPNLTAGGRFQPPCHPSQGATALILPYRNRETQLRSFLHHIHPILQRQLLEYIIIVVEQTENETFNRGLLMNIGYKESLRFVSDNIDSAPFQCYIFHDVDLHPESDRGIYTCQGAAIHLSGYIDKFRYKIFYEEIFGGASAIPRNVFELINGYSNVYFGWGGEDDDVRMRLVNKSVPIVRYPKSTLSYKMVKHHHESSNKKNERRHELLEDSLSRMDIDGISSLKYLVVERNEFPTHIRVLVQVSSQEISKAVYGKSDQL